MKQIITILSAYLFMALCSCSDESLPDLSEKKSDNKCSVTFTISRSGGSDLDMTTRSNNIAVITENYSVMFYLFQADGNEYKLIREPELVTSPVLTLENLTENAEYRYVFVAIYNPTKDEATAKILQAYDFGTTGMDFDGFTIDLPVFASTNTQSLLRNCFLDIFNKNQQLTYQDNEIIGITEDRDIFGAGAYFLPGATSSAISVVLERQIGVVEFKYEEAVPGDKLECSFASDYYRLYLSQMVKDVKNVNYTSENFARFPNPVEDTDGSNYSEGDYYTISHLFVTNNQGLPTFKKEVTLSGTEKSIKVYMPYTTSAAIGTEVADKYKAHYNRTGVTGDASIPLDNIILNITKADGTSQKFEKVSAPFPIYRNGKTIFTTVGADYLSIKFGNNNTDNGIYIPDEDKWNGDN